MNLEDLASETLGNIDPDIDGVKDVDFILILTILKYIIEAYECFKTQTALAVRACNRPNLLQRLWLRAAVAQHAGMLRSGRIAQGILVTGRSLNYTELVEVVRGREGIN